MKMYKVIYGCTRGDMEPQQRNFISKQKAKNFGEQWVKDHADLDGWWVWHPVGLSKELASLESDIPKQGEK